MQACTESFLGAGTLFIHEQENFDSVQEIIFYILQLINPAGRKFAQGI